MKKKRTTPELVLRCGCRVAFRSDANEPPICPRHGRQPVARTSAMPAPRIRGVATGPHVTTEDLPPHVGRLVEGR